jgi:hypothetical protein
MNVSSLPKGEKGPEERVIQGKHNGLSKDSGHSAPPFDEIQQRVETVTPVLKQILEFRPAPHWGIND